jgi:hypothetical protein
MFDIINKRKKIVVDCFTSNPAILEYFPITHAVKNYPDWWKRMEASFPHTSTSGIEHPAPTIKRCDGMLSLYSKGFHLKMWSDLILETSAQGEFRYQYSSDENHPIVSHSKRQIGSAFGAHVHLKILSPWMIEEKTGVDFLFTGSSWNYPDKLFDWNIIPGCINFKNQSSTHINLFMPAKQARLELTAGEPIVHIIPVSEKEVDLRCHELTDKEYRTKMLKYSFMSSFMGRFKKNAKRS